MAVSINTGGTYSATRVDSADTATNWSATKLEGAGGAPSLLASVGTIDLVAEGTDARAARTNKQRVQISYNHAVGYDFTSGSSGTGTDKIPSGIAYVWAAFLAAGIAFTKANGGGQIVLGDGTNSSYWNVFGSDTYSGGLVKWAAATEITPDENSGTTADLGDITEVGFVTDVGGATARFDNFVVDAMEVGDGLSLQGTTTGDKLFAESVTQDAATAIGILETNNGIIFAQGSVEFDGTAMTSNSESLVFTDTLGGAYTYNLDITGTVDFVNSSVAQAGAVDYNFDSSAATTFAMAGGGIKGYLNVATGAGQAMSGIVFQSGGTATIANDLTNSTFNLCGQITLTGTLTNCLVDESPAAVAVLTDDLADITGCTFNSDGTGHAVELSSIGGGTMSWDNAETGYAAVDGSTGNETIYVNVALGTLTINVVAGASTPTIRTAGATVSVVSGLSTISFDVSPAITGYEWRIYTVTAKGSLAGASEVDGEESAASSSQSYSYTHVGGVFYALQFIPHSGIYKEDIKYLDSSALDQSFTFNLIIDINN